MRRKRASAPLVSLFPFLSVLVCVMGVLGFMASSFALVEQTQKEVSSPQKNKEFQWIGAPAYVNPIFIRCQKDQLIYYDLFSNQDKQISLDDLLRELQNQDGPLLQYLQRIVETNRAIKKNFGTTEHYPLLLVYPEGVVMAELLTATIERIEGLNIGLEPMMPDWQVPYQSQR